MKLASMTPEEILDALQSAPLQSLDALPERIGIYALADHLGTLRYIGQTEADCFSNRILSRHVTGSEERSQKYCCNYNIGRMWRDRKSPYHIPTDAKIAKRLKTAFIRKYCRCSCVSLSVSLEELSIIEKECRANAPKFMVSWNDTRERVTRFPEPRDLSEIVISELGFGAVERAALERQAVLFEAAGGVEHAQNLQIPRRKKRLHLPPK